MINMTPRRSTRQTGLAALACTECRKQHLKCDANQPSCSRCTQGGFVCQYLPSRRGGRRKPRHDIVYHHPQQHRSSASKLDDAFGISASHYSPGNGTGNNIQTPQHATGLPLQVSSAPGPMNTPDSSNISLQRSSRPGLVGVPWPAILSPNDASSDRLEPPERSWDEDDRCARLYYEHFHVAHPILVPSTLYKDRDYPPFLQLVVEFVGSHYLPSGPRQQLKDKVDAALETNPDRSPCMVQAWLIYSIALYARGERQKAQEAFSQSAEIAFELGMHRGDFASSAHPERSVEAESMRRTWWELYITDIFMAVPLKTITFRCTTVAPEVGLPCDESAYTGCGEIPSPRKMLDFKRRVFAAEEIAFSSFSYRIEAVTILCRVLVLNRLRDYHRDHLQAIENALVSWVNHLPSRKLDIVDSYGNVDEMIFQAHLIIAYATMLLHLPRSDLRPLLTQPDDCFWPSAPCHLSSTFPRLVHSMKATEASRRVSDCISICPNIQKHTPFVIPALALCGMIQLATSINHSEECFDHHCNRVTLILGCLKSTKRTWGSAECAYDCVRSTAADILSDSIEKWNAEPLKSIPTPQDSNDMGRTNHNVPPAVTVAEGQGLMIPELAPGFIDPTCYNASFFNCLADFDLS
ncbi:specific transcription factor domain protein [Aspergillus parasiticus SU-1]|uniref:Specific transcription factor domain protein n=1 Tax=Aspergillus parasiticus (strain ATCC 56775 / NRRL 5862 / SRRC 143 / SU-1) TaxID=1403190 RepID=A0A0F0IN19_ASPPU|nr:specific transcription factor domain protein [Aspergillus parasiticus SU-1]